ncbi:MAG: hypothetical protein KKB94_02205, partial [Proteobacteria bacterium]|nr:hypothetical protein [Pseudomonadota bacterium]
MVNGERLSEIGNGQECPAPGHIHIQVAVTLPVAGTYTYSATAELASMVVPGKRVLVPFGGRRVTGYVLEPCRLTPGQPIKQILDILDEKPLFPSSMVPFFKWVADYYLHP